MYTVVVPTMWKFAPFVQFIDSLLCYHLVDEIIVINNDFQNTPESFSQIQHEKLKVLNFGKNIGCNAAWNVGALTAKNDFICFLNDDIIFDLGLFNKLLPYLDDPQTGVIGLSPGNEEFKQPQFINGMIDVFPWERGMHTYGFGCLMFINKKNFIPIPNELFLYYGDNWIFDTCLNLGLINYIFCNIVHYTPFAATTSGLVNNYLEKETPIYQLAFRNFMLSIDNFKKNKQGE